MNDIINKFLLAGDKVMPKMHLRQPGFTYRPCGLFTKNKERIQKFKQTRDSRCIYRNELDKACFQHDMTYGDFKDLTKRIAADKVLKNKAFNIAKDPKYDGYQRGLAPMVYKFFDKKTKDSGVTNLANKSAIKSIPQNEQLAEELHKPIIKKFKKRKVCLAFKGNIWGADLADMQLISKFNNRFRFLLYVIDIYSKYAWVALLKDEKGESIVNAFQKNLKESAKTPRKIWVDKGSEFYNFHFEKWLKDNNIEMYSAHNEGKSVFAERSIRTIKNKIYKYMTSISKNVYVDKLDDIINEYSNIYHRTIKMKPIDVKDNTYIDFGKEVNDNDPKFKVGGHVRISKNKKKFVKGYTPNWSEDVLVIKEIKNAVPWTYVINDLNGEEIIGTFYENECKRQTNKNLE